MAKQSPIITLNRTLHQLSLVPRLYLPDDPGQGIGSSYILVARLSCVYFGNLPLGFALFLLGMM